MGIKDMIIADVILIGAFYLLYRSLWKKGHCQGSGCEGGSCGKK